MTKKGKHNASKKLIKTEQHENGQPTRDDVGEIIEPRFLLRHLLILSQYSFSDKQPSIKNIKDSTIANAYQLEDINFICK